MTASARIRGATLALAVAASLPAAAGAAATPPSTLLAPRAFARVVAAPGTVTINVHVPDEGSIPGTDRWIPYDRIAQLERRLPPRSTQLAVYCRSGRMSAVAVGVLRRLGYTRLAELRGGMEAWRASGRRLLPPR